MRAAAVVSLALALSCSGPGPGGTGGGATAGGSTAGGSTAGGSTAGGSSAGGSTAGGSSAGGSTAGSGGGSASDGGLLFASDWGTALGSSPAALRDTNKRYPWEVVLGSGMTVVASTGLDFPTPNVLEVVANETAPDSGVIRFGAPQLTQLPVPPVGGSLYYRWYIRVVVPDSIASESGGSPHPIQDGPAASQTNWMFEMTVQRDGGWGPRLFSFATPFPNNRWDVTAPLRKNQTYRIELQYQRVSATTATPHARVYDSAGTLLYSDAQFSNQGATTTLAANVVVNTPLPANLARFQSGNNAPGWTLPPSAFPFPMFYEGGFCIRSDTWCGPYQPGEGL